MSDPTKKWQRNIRVPPELWAYVQSLAPKGRTRNGDCSSVICSWIKHRMATVQGRRMTHMEPQEDVPIAVELSDTTVQNHKETP